MAIKPFDYVRCVDAFDSDLELEGVYTVADVAPGRVALCCDPDQWYAASRFVVELSPEEN